ncbi:MAG: bifunctional 4-hydroxy-2-oxoglutarate aldolase/2-dehydro-3-deoxy-phosphogluconate aldolase [Planctomycetota bacterium]
MNSQLPQALLERIEQSGVIAVLVVDQVNHAVPLARALLAGGVSVMELTLRTPAAIDALKAIRAEVPEMLAGIGTILTPEQVDAVKEAGGAFGVAPGTNPRVIRRAQEVGLPFSPGIATPSDIEAALELGCRDLKFFPAEPSGGLKYLQSAAAPYAHLGVRFIPLGGLNAENMRTYLADKLTLAIGGSWLAPRDVIGRQDWGTIEKNAREARAAVDAVRSPKT